VCGTSLFPPEQNRVEDADVVFNKRKHPSFADATKALPVWGKIYIQESQPKR
jgi:hypothetical protein